MIIIQIYGHAVECRILRRHACGTVDVERLSDGRCFRVSGLPLLKVSA
jgi:hypothetical protein